MKELKQHNILYGRMAYSLLIAAVYLLGRCIPIPWVLSETGQDASGGIQDVIRSVVGSGASGLNVFSLGLMPWIAATILVYFLYSASGRSRRMAVSGKNRLTILLTLLISLFQAILETADAQLTSAYGLEEWVFQVLTVMVLTTGSLVLVWLVRRNEAWGIGGQKLLICMNLLDTLLGVLAGWIGEQFPLQSGKTIALEMALLILGILVILLITLVCERTELRIPVQRLMVSSRYAKDDYLPVKLYPIGTMPVVYAMTIFSLIGSLCTALQWLLPGVPQVFALCSMLSLSTLPGVILFCLLLWILNLAGSVLFLDPAGNADKLQRSGGYVVGMRPRPGETASGTAERILRGSILGAAAIGSVVMTAIILPPFLVRALTGEAGEIYSLPVTLMMLTGMLSELTDEARMYRAMQEYRPVLPLKQEETAPDVSAEEKKAPIHHFVSSWYDGEALKNGEKLRQADLAPAAAEANCIFDDTVSQLRMFARSGEEAELVCLSYAPHLWHFLHRQGLENVRVWSVFDELQGITCRRPSVLHWQELDWSDLEKGGAVEWIPMRSSVEGYQNGKHVATVEFTQDGCLCRVDWYRDDETQIRRRDLYDDRGFRSCRIEYKEKHRHVQPIYYFYNAFEELLFYIDGLQGSVTIKGGPTDVFRERTYRYMDDLIQERLKAHFAQCSADDVVVIAANHEHDKLIREALSGQRIVYSFFRERFDVQDLFRKEQEWSEAERSVKEQNNQLEQQRKVKVQKLLDLDKVRLAEQQKAEGAKKSSAQQAGQQGNETDALKKAEEAYREEEQEFQEREQELQNRKEKYERLDRSYQDAKLLYGQTMQSYAEHAAMLVTDTEELEKRIDDYLKNSLHRKVLNLCPYDLSPSFGRSAQLRELKVFLPVDGLVDVKSHKCRSRDQGVLKAALDDIVDYMVWHPDVWILFGTQEGIENIDQYAKPLDSLVREKLKNRTKNVEGRHEPLTEEEKSRILARFVLVSFRTDEDLARIMEETRLIIDLRPEVDLRLQAAGVSAGIPQAVYRRSRYVIHTENGYVLKSASAAKDALKYYLDGLGNWNHAQKCCAEMVRQYAGGLQMQQWKETLNSGE